MTLLTIVSDACDRMGLTRPTSVTTSSDQNVRVLLGLAQEEGKSLAKRHDWQVLQAEHTFATVDATASYALPSGFRYIIKDTVFNRTSRRRMVGDLTPDQWQQTQASLVTRVNPAFRIRTNLFYISPTPTAAETIAYEYLSKNWCQSNAVAQSAWTLDSDTGILDEDLMILGIIWRFRAAKGLDYAESMQTYEMEVNKAIMNDGARTRIDTSCMETDRVPQAPQVPETLVF